MLLTVIARSTWKTQNRIGFPDSTRPRRRLRYPASQKAEVQNSSAIHAEAGSARSTLFEDYSTPAITSWWWYRSMSETRQGVGKLVCSVMYEGIVRWSGTEKLHRVYDWRSDVWGKLTG